jgi:predicted TIM-barrel fold metal-dependent hydrolase
MIIDCHCHAGKGDGFTGPWDTAAPLDRYLARAARAGIDRTVLFSAFHSNYSAANEEVARIVRSRPDKFYGFAFVHADRDRGRVHQMVKTAVEQYGFLGIKVHRYDARISREICEGARAYGLPVLYDPVAEVAVAELLAREYPDVNFIFAHLGSFSDDWRAQLAFIDLMTRHPNIYSDTSGVRRFDLLEDAVNRAGPEKLLFGTDGPWLHPGVELTKVLALELPKADQDLILGGNLIRLISGQRVTRSVRRTSIVPSEFRQPVEFKDPWASEMQGAPR